MFKRIYLFTFDCLRADYLSLYGGAVRARNIERLAKNGIVVPWFIANGPTTFSSFPTIHQSRYFFFVDGLRPDPLVPTLSELLGRAGYYNVGVSSNVFMSKVFGWDRGFHKFYDEFVPKDTKKLASKRTKKRPTNAKVLIKETLKKLLLNKLRMDELFFLLRRVKSLVLGASLPYTDARRVGGFIESEVVPLLRSKEKTFLWVHYMDTHFPFNSDFWREYFSSKKQYLGVLTNLYYKDPSKISEEELKFVRYAYSESIRYVDREFGRLLDALEDRGLLDDSIVIITADHGEELLEHGHFGHWKLKVFNELVHIPLIISGVDFEAPSVPRGTIDLLPTLVNILGLAPNRRFEGKNMFSGENRLYYIDIAKVETGYDVNYNKFTVGVFFWPWKFIFSSKHKPSLYNLKKDPRESRNVILEHRDLALELLKLASEHYKMGRRYRGRIKYIKKIRRAIRSAS